MTRCHRAMDFTLYARHLRGKAVELALRQLAKIFTPIQSSSQIIHR
uniref:Uncharacterized protein n=1 Tax=Anguilla anguilla TaxID=7936 RepID=A0A0E9QF72_ANGAN